MIELTNKSEPSKFLSNKFVQLGTYFVLFMISLVLACIGPLIVTFVFACTFSLFYSLFMVTLWDVVNIIKGKEYE